MTGRGLPRALEAAAAFAGLVVLSPLLAVAALAVAVSSKGGVFFRQTRVGRGGVPFVLYKLRTMRRGGAGPGFTAGDDPRVTAVGKLLRRTKLDELPSLANVLAGDMSFVGPRPEVPEYVDPDDPSWRRVLEARPGLTDPVTLRLRNEEELLAGVEGDRRRFYEEALLPFKLRGYAAYLERRTAWSDLAVLGRTLLLIVWPGLATMPSREEIEQSRQGGGHDR